MGARPRLLKIKGEPYRLVLLRVQTTYEDGTPEDLTLIKPHMVCELSADPTRNRFVTAYLPEVVLQIDPPSGEGPGA